MQKLAIPLIVAILFASPTQGVFAQSYDREVLMVQMQEILAQLRALQIELNNMKTADEGRVLGASTRRLTRSEYYDGPYEAIYLTNGILLEPYGNTQQSRTDLGLWNLWRQVVGNQVTSRYITEYRLYRDADAEYDAFIEEIGDSDDWIFGVNLAAVDLNDPRDRKSVIELFIHEYAHILHYYHDDVADAFTDDFWDPPYRSDRYYISDYARIDSEEDFAESFMHFVLQPRPHGDTVIDEKLHFFYNYDSFRDIRDDIRDRLSM